MTPESELYLKLAELLRARIGLNPDSIGKQALEHAVGHRLKALRLDNAAGYVSRLATDAIEWSEFLEEIIVPESWFFRELTPFRCAGEFVRRAMLSDHRRPILRFLSVPCSRGEEPYSLAMTLLDAGLLPAQFEIVACDLSQRSLEFAQRGRYRSIAFRETDPDCRRLVRQHFQISGDEYHLNSNIRSQVKFQQANLAAPNFGVGLGSFDFIFCRNVLIYLTEEARQRALAAFGRMLLPGGLLYLGHSECRLGPQAGAVAWNAQFPAAFTWPRATTIADAAVDFAPLRASTATTAPPGRVSTSSMTRKHPVITPLQTSGNNSTAEATDELPLAKQLADSGQLDRAEEVCRKLLRDRPTDADAHCLLGVVVQARGELAEAEKHYQRSLFLQPDHLEAITHVLLLARLRGDTEHVANYQRRLDRLRLGT